MDILANSFCKILNAQKRRHNIVKLYSSKKILNMLLILHKEGYISGFKESNKEFIVGLKYEAATKPSISSIKKISKPGKRTYIKHKDIKPLNSGLGIYILSTSKGLKTENEALNLGLGGEVLALVK